MLNWKCFLNKIHTFGLGLGTDKQLSKWEKIVSTTNLNAFGVFLSSFLSCSQPFLLAWTPHFMQKIKNRRSFSTQEFPRCHQHLRCSRNTSSNSTATKLPSRTINCSLELIPGRIPGVLGRGYPKGLWLRVTRAGAVREQRQGPLHPSPNLLRWEGPGEQVCQNQGTLRLRRGRRGVYVSACLIVCGFCLSQYPAKSVIRSVANWQ